MKKTNQRAIVTGALVLSFILLFLINNMRITYAQNGAETINLSQNFMLEEFSENFGGQENVTSVEIDLGSSRWNVTDVELNFTNIKLEREIKSIEDSEEGQNYDRIYRASPALKVLGLGVEFYLSVPTKLYGVYIYGYKYSAAEQVDIQIRDYDSVDDKPSSTFLHNQSLNISLIPGWYHQNFYSPISLTPGKYYLVLINPSYSVSAANYWAYTTTPNNSSLHISEYKNDWSNGIQGTPYLYKLIQKVNRTYNPKDIEMAVEIDGKSYNVSNGDVSGSGNVSISNLNYSPNDETLNIPIKNNESITKLKLNFSLSYRIKLENNLFSHGNVTIGEHLANNEWIVAPQLNRTNDNYSVEYETPQNWKDRRVLRNLGSGWEDISGEVTITNNLIFIPDNTIIVGSDWRITANSTKIDFTLQVSKTEFNAGEKIQFTLTSPCIVGNYTFILYNSLGFEETKNKTSCDQPLTPPEFSYSLPSDSVSGLWNAIIFWNNESDAGVQSQNFMISGSTTIISGGGGGGGDGGSTIVTGLDPTLILTISILIILVMAGSLTMYQSAKRFKRTRDLKMQKLRNKFIDSLNLNYIMISENISGLNVYEQFFVGREIDPSLISGFLTAIRSFGIEITGTFQQSQTIKLEFQNSKILMNEFRNFRIILIMGENPSDDFIESINNLSYDIEKEYGELIRDFDGSLNEFTGIGKLIERHLNISFLYPLKVSSSKVVDLSPAENSLLNKARVIMKQNNLGYIFTSFLIDDLTFEPKRIKAIFGLIEKGIFEPINVNE